MSGSTKLLDQPSKHRPAQPKPTGLRSTPQRQHQAPWVVLGLLLVAGAGLGFAIWSSSLSDRRPVLVAARSIQTGEQIAATDLRVVTIGADSGVELVDQDQSALLVGRIAMAPIPAGTPLQAAMVGDATPVPDGQLVVGATFAAGEYPAGLRAGDRLVLLETTRGTTGEASPAVLAESTVWSAQRAQSASGGQLFVSLLVDRTEAPRVADAAAGGRLRLLLAGGETE